MACLIFAFAGTGLAKEHDIPYRIDPLKEPKPNGTTLLLWRFEDGKATDSTIGGNHGEAVGEAEGAVEGRFGRGLYLRGGSVRLSEKVSLHHLASPGEAEAVVMVDFWCKPKSFPTGKEAILLDVPKGLGVRLVLTREGLLRVSGTGIAATASKQPIPLGQWSHVAVRPRSFIQPNGIYVDKHCMEVLVNGFTVILAKMPRYRAVPAELNPFSVGNSLRRDAPFDGWLDEFRITRGAAGFYRIIRQRFLRPQRTEPLVRSTEHFRDPSAQVYAETFDGPWALRRVTPAQKPQLLPTAPPVVQVSSAGKLRPGETESKGDDEPDFVEEMIEGEKQLAMSPPIAIVDGVRGKALVVRGGPARVELSRPLVLRDGTVEFWFKPGNWDNLATPPVKNAGWSYRNRYAHLITLWGLPRGREGEAAPLITLSIRRDRGSRPVAPEFEKYFARPKLPIVPHKWVHVQLIRSRRFPHLNGGLLDAGHGASAKFASDEIWQTHQAAYFTLGNGYETSFDELRLYTCAFEGIERENARASFTEVPPQHLDEATASHRVDSLGKIKVDTTAMPLISRFSGGWLTGWVSGTVTRGPVKVFFGYRLAIGKIIVAVVLNDPKSAASAEIEFRLPHTGEKRTATIPVFEEGKGGVVLDVGLLPEGNHPVKGVLLNAAGEKIADFESTFHRMPLPWLNNTLGLPDTPPPPFKPVKVNGRSVTAVQREHAVGSDGNFSSIKVRDKEILASPIRWEVQVGDQLSVFEGKEPAKFGHRKPVETNWQASAHASGIAMRSSVSFEYDGTARYDIEMKPTQGKVVVDRLSLQIPLKAEYGRLFHVLPTEGRFRDYVTAGFLPPGDGLIWDSKTWKKVMPVSTGAKGNFASMLWLGGVVRGLVWFADTDKGWVPDDDQPAATIIRKDGVVTLGLHFISRRFTLDEPRRIIYGILATPPKPLPEDHRLWNRGNPRKVGPISWRLTSCHAFAPWKVTPVPKAFDYWPRGDDWEFARLATSVQRSLWNSETPHGKYPKGTSLILYHDANKCPVHPAMVPYFRWEWRWRSYSKTRVDHLVWYMDKWISHGVDGVYIDDIFPGGDWNLEPLGTSYILPDGRKQLGASHFYYREFLKRFYALFQAHGKRPIITTHMTDTLLLPEHAFASAIYDGEHGARGHGANKTYIDAWPLDYLMTIRNAERTGLITVNFGLQVPDNWEATAPELWKYVAKRSWKAVALLFDSSHPPGRFEQPYYGMETEVFPFWRNSHVVRVEPVFAEPVTDRDLPVAKWWTRLTDHFHRSLASQPLRATLFKRGNRCMIVVVNFLRRSVGAKITLRLDELGVPPEHQAGLTAEDIDDWLPPPGADLEKLHVADLPRSKSAALLSEIRAKGGFPEVPADAGGSRADLQADVETMLEQPEGVELHLPEPDESDMPVKRDKFFTVDVKGNVLTLNVAAHNFRAIQLRWGPEQD